MPITSTGIDETKARFEAMAARLRDLSPVMEVAAQDTRTLIDDSFQSSKSPDGTPWADLSDMTLAARVRRAIGPSRIRNNMIGPMREGQSRYRTKKWTRRRSEKASAALFGAKPLIDKGLLRNSVTTKQKKTSISFGTNRIQAGTQQFGRSDNKVFGKAAGPIPARPFMPVTSSGRGKFALMTTGRAGEHWSQVRVMVATYIRTGEIT